VESVGVAGMSPERIPPMPGNRLARNHRRGRNNHRGRNNRRVWSLRRVRNRARIVPLPQVGPVVTGVGDVTGAGGATAIATAREGPQGPAGTNRYALKNQEGTSRRGEPNPGRNAPIGLMNLVEAGGEIDLEDAGRHPAGMAGPPPRSPGARKDLAARIAPGVRSPMLERRPDRAGIHGRLGAGLPGEVIAGLPPGVNPGANLARDPRGLTAETMRATIPVPAGVGREAVAGMDVR
jgi:hypothetical protein